MGPVASGTVCVDGQIERQNDGSCGPDGSLVCGADGKSFFLCTNGGLVDMGSVAAATVCVDGVIEAIDG